VYVPRVNALDDAEELRVLVASVGSAQLVTVDADGFPAATLLPVMWEPDPSTAGRLIFHIARANPHWKSIDDQPALAIVTGAQAYVSPSWYPSKAETGRVVPTWNYSAVHFKGRLRIHADPDWVRQAVTHLTQSHERHRELPWSIDDAPAPFIEQQLHAIVGIELIIGDVQAKAKLSQNRSEADQAGVIDGLRREGGLREREMADMMAAQRPSNRRATAS
jgi:transcriptional regulator